MEPETSIDQLFDKNCNKLSGKYIKVNSVPQGIDHYDKNGNNLDGTYKKKEQCEGPVVAYNKNEQK